jgi:hypothetical protein
MLDGGIPERADLGAWGTYIRERYSEHGGRTAVAQWLERLSGTQQAPRSIPGRRNSARFYQQPMRIQHTFSFYFPSSQTMPFSTTIDCFAINVRATSSPLPADGRYNASYISVLVKCSFALSCIDLSCVRSHARVI